MLGKDTVISSVRALVLVSVASFAIVSSNANASASQLTDEGMRLYNAGQFEKAGSYFEAEVKANPKSANGYYLLGNTFVRLNRSAEAKSAYDKAILLDPKGPAGQYSRQAKEGLTVPVQKPITASGPPDMDALDAKSSAMAVSKQTGENQRRLEVECQAKVDEISRNADDKIATLQREMSERLAANGSAIYAGRSFRVKIYDPATENAAVRDEYTPQIKQIRDDAAKQTDAVKALYKERIAAYESSAVTIDRSYVGQNSGKVRLVPSGTSLYNRNYQSDGEASGDAVPVMASPAKRLVDVTVK